jgi:hypothetical protein
MPSFEALEIGRAVPALPVPRPMIVAEKGTARAVAADGEIPWRLTPGATYEYADLSGASGSFATIDFSESPPLIFIGREVTLDDLGLAHLRSPAREAKRVSAAQLSCPKCGGPLKLRAPDQSERVTCPNCSSLLDIHEGQLQYLSTLEPGKFKPSIPLGSVGNFAEGKLTVLGFVVRSVLFDRKYFWSEYLLYNPQAGFRWLVESDNQWSYVKPVPPGEVSGGHRTATFQGRGFRIFQDATATVEYVTGEFYWKVAKGEEVRVIDYVRPPQAISVELSNTVSPRTYRTFAKNAIGWDHREEGQAGGEMNCSLGLYMKPAEVEQAFGISGLKRAWNVAPNQPNPYKGLGKTWAAFAAVIVLLALLFFATASSRQVFSKSYQFNALPHADGTQTVFTDAFDLVARKNISITASSNVDNSWVYFEGDLINQDTGLVQPFALPVEYYHGYDEDGAWTEGNGTKTVYLSALPAGTYTMRLEGQWEKWSQRSPSVDVRIVQGVPRFEYLGAALALVSIIPAYTLVRHWMFEVKRWNDSMYNPYQGKDS